MARRCHICQKGYKTVWKRIKLRGKFNPTTKRRQKPNLQWFRLVGGKRILICASCKSKLTKKSGV